MIEAIDSNHRYDPQRFNHTLKTIERLEGFNTLIGRILENRTNVMKTIHFFFYINFL